MSEQDFRPFAVLFREVSLGNTTLHFFSEEDEFIDGQIGYSVNPHGNSLVGGENGDWKETWRVLGYEDLCGDPVFVDVRIPELPVFTAPHGMGDWNATQISDSFEAFNKSLKIVAEIALGRENAVRLEGNPIGSGDAALALDRISTISPNSDIEFWQLFLGVYR